MSLIKRKIAEAVAYAQTAVETLYVKEASNYKKAVRETLIEVNDETINSTGTGILNEEILFQLLISVWHDSQDSHSEKLSCLGAAILTYRELLREGFDFSKLSTKKNATQHKTELVYKICQLDYIGE